jgi:hypothetical protein
MTASKLQKRDDAWREDHTKKAIDLSMDFALTIARNCLYKTVYTAISLLKMPMK